MKYSTLLIAAAAMFVFSSCSQSVTGNAASGQSSASTASTTTSGTNTQVSATSAGAKPESKAKQVEMSAPVNSEKAASPVN